MIQILWTLCKYVILVLTLMLIYFVYTGLVKPYLMYIKYKKYPNVYVGKKFIPISGYFTSFAESIKEGKIYYYKLREELSQAKGCDVAMLIYGTNPEFKIVSPQGIKEFEDLYVRKIDRILNFKGLGRMVTKSFDKFKTDEIYLEKRKIYVKLLSLNSSSKFIPDMVSRLKNRVSTFEVGKVYD